MSHVPKREFLDLSVREVSLVDEPANEHRFVVVKRKGEGSSMSESTVQVSDPAKLAAFSLEMDALIAKGKALGLKLDDETQDVSKTASPESMEAKLRAAKKVAKAQKKAAKKASKMAAYKAMLEKSGMKGAELKKAMDAAEEHFNVKPGPGAQPPTKEPTTKTFREEGEETIGKSMDTVLDGVMFAISKAKAFTPKRAKELKEAVAKLSGLLGELESMPDGGRNSVSSAEDSDEDGNLKPLPKGQGNVPPSGLQDERIAQPIMKALGEVQEVIKAIQADTKKVGERVEAIEKTRAAPTSTGSEVTETQVGKKKSLFAGVV